MMSPESDIVDLSQIVGDIEVPCDYAEADSCPDEPARWVLYCIQCSCGEGGFRLACETCKDIRLLSEGGVICQGCGYVTVPARLAYSSIEPLEKR